MLTSTNLVTYSVSSLGLIALVYKFYRFYYLKNLAKRYFQDKTVLITGASSGLGKGIHNLIIFLQEKKHNFYDFWMNISACRRALPSWSTANHLRQK
jgi:hypothetical protein